MLFLEAFVVGLGFMLGVEVVLGFCMALKHVRRGVKK